jgi:SAM-dependent methyltransferase
MRAALLCCTHFSLKEQMANINDSRSDNDFAPRQALAPTPGLYDELVGDTMESLARISLAQLPPISANAVIHDNGCGTGSGTAAVMSATAGVDLGLTIEGTDINDEALRIYRSRITSSGWPATARQMDSQHLSFPDNTFTHCLCNALLFVLPNDGVTALREAYRCLKPGGVLIANSWHFVPNMLPVQRAAVATRPRGTSIPREGMDKWSAPEFLRDVLVAGGFEASKVQLTKGVVEYTTPELTRYATMLWSFMGGTGESGWLESDERNWDGAVRIVEDELRKTPGFQELSDGRATIRFIANIATAMK